MGKNGKGENTPWPKIGEIDVLEFIGCKKHSTMGNLHVENHHGENQVSAYKKNHMDVEDWHVYGVDWYTFGVVWRDIAAVFRRLIRCTHCTLIASGIDWCN